MEDPLMEVGISYDHDVTLAKKSKPSNETENKRKKICQICGDFSLGYNFGAITCESCKAFFRRNALRLKEFTCPFENTCNIDSITRRFCQKCRLKKCFSVGMRKEWILTENEKIQKRKKRTEANRHIKSIDANGLNQTSHRHRGKPRALVKPNSRCIIQDSLEDIAIKSTDPENNDSLISSSYFDPKVIPNLLDNEMRSYEPASNEQPAFQLSEKLPTFEAEAEQKNMETGHPAPSIKCKEEKMIQEVNNPKEEDTFLSLDQVISVAIKAEYEADSMLKGCKPALAKLNDREQAKLHELYIASRSLAEPVGIEDDSSFNRYSSEPTLISVINLTDLAIKRIIKMAKQIFSFTQLCQEDQVALLKGGCIELMILRSVINFDPEKNGWQIPGSSSLRVLSMDVLKEASQLGVNLYEEHLKFVSSFSPVWKNDENIMLLMSAIALFSPDRVNVVHAKVIKCEQDGYFYLLRRYLESLYVGCEAREVYLQLIGKLLELHRLNESHIKLFMEVNPKQIEPLLIEIFDLNSHKIQK